MGYCNEKRKTWNRSWIGYQKQIVIMRFWNPNPGRACSFDFKYDEANQGAAVANCKCHMLPDQTPPWCIFYSLEIGLEQELFTTDNKLEFV
jgi:hypothetical protein